MKVLFSSLLLTRTETLNEALDALCYDFPQPSVPFIFPLALPALFAPDTPRSRWLGPAAMSESVVQEHDALFLYGTLVVLGTTPAILPPRSCLLTLLSEQASHDLFSLEESLRGISRAAQYDCVCTAPGMAVHVGKWVS